jgi:uncharacterized protein YjbI with pentapeptide repeats
MNHSRLMNGVLLRKVKVKKKTNFRYSRIYNISYFDWCDFQDTLDFEHALFRNTAYAGFGYCNFNNFANFHNTLYLGGVSFDSNEFLGKVDFEQSTFDSLAIFEHNTFNKEANFQSCRFTGNSRFYKTSSKVDLNFENSHFFKESEFTYSEFEGQLSFESCRFDSSAGFYQVDFIGIANFNHCKFKDYLRFNSCEFHDYVVFSYTKFPKEINFCHNSIIRNEIDFTQGNFRRLKEKIKIYLTGSDISKIRIDWEHFALGFYDSEDNPENYSVVYTDVIKKLRSIGNNYGADKFQEELNKKLEDDKSK